MEEHKVDERNYNKHSIKDIELVSSVLPEAQSDKFDYHFSKEEPNDYVIDLICHFLSLLIDRIGVKCEHDSVQNDQKRDEKREQSMRAHQVTHLVETVSLSALG